MTSQETFVAQETFIARLRRHRERNQISIQQIAITTRVKPELFEAFERNDLSGWPRGLYARAWIRGYATVVGLDAIDTVDEFCRLFPQGDRRMATTVQEVAAIVAHPSEYREDIAPEHDRRRDGARHRRRAVAGLVCCAGALRVSAVEPRRAAPHHPEGRP